LHSAIFTPRQQGYIASIFEEQVTKKLSEFYQRLNRAWLVVLLTAVVLAMAALATISLAAAAAPQLMFVQSADDLRVDQAKSTLRLVKLSQQTL
jgi:hypothetical protein